MALKDWKKTRNNEQQIIFEQKKDKIDINGWNQTLIITNFKPIWEVAISYERSYDYHIKKTFKTKSQALKFAKEYMRKN